jgi:hypothetical protein
MTDSAGRWIVSNLPSGRVEVKALARGFQHLVQKFNYDGSTPVPFVSTLNVGTVTETVEVSAGVSSIGDYQRNEREAKKIAAQQQMAVSANVTSLQQRVSGVLPVRVDVPRAGNSYHFVRPLVLDEETKVTFTYKSK